jgi:pimeloyl-ACP methyl ester carboxylesterase/protein-tyrosine phosphatase
MQYASSVWHSEANSPFSDQVLSTLYLRRMASLYDARATDPALLARNSEIKPYTTTRFTYPGVRVFYKRHQQADRLPKSPAPVPLLVFVHGLGGSVAQFHPLLTSLTPIASCLAIDLPGCGVSQFAPRSWAAYTTDALVELLETIIEDYRDVEEGQGVVLIGHSMGASLAALLAAPRIPPQTELTSHVVGLVAICPSAGPPSEKMVSVLRKLLWIPECLFNLWRAWDRRGGPESASVRRFVGEDADPEAKRLQNLYNWQSRSPVWRRMAAGVLPDYQNGVPQGGLPTVEVWAQLNIPVFLVGGENDNVTPPTEVEAISDFLHGIKVPSDYELVDNGAINDAAAPIDSSTALLDPEPEPEPEPESEPGPERAVGTIDDLRDEDFERQKRTVDADDPPEDPTTPSEKAPAIPPLHLHPAKVVRSVILPKPATHALLYTPSTAHILAGLISDFLVAHVTGRLALGWQLQFLSRDGKWDVKNLEKWQKVAPVSDPIGGVFHAMKTLREVDEIHCPREFAKNWGVVIKDIIDISHDNPVYDPQGLEAGGIHYHKFPTVSKVPPTDTEIRGFIDIVDKIRANQKERAKMENWTDNYTIGVHCHYGFNRTGFFIACYLVERCGFSAKEAIDRFAEARPKGIKHAHFRDRLYVRYSGVRSEGQ